MKKFLLLFLSVYFSMFLYGSDTKIGTYERLGKFVPLNLVFTDEHGVKKTLGEFMENKPTVISVNYFHCPGICGPQIDGMTKSLDKLNLKEGKDYKALTISFVTTDGPKDAMWFKKNHTAVIRKDFNKSAWSFLTTPDKKTVDALTNALGYNFKKIINKQGFIDYIHPAGLVILSPKGKITRYLNGIDYLPFDLQMAIGEASKGIARPTIARAVAFCFSFDPKSNKYVFETKKIFGAVMTLFMIMLFIYFVLTSKSRKRKKGDDLHE
ncbi:MAG: SCO family protein [Sulfurospirillaceae bacterium]|nr:SCO family protein [Sulfurospirillaceae bacterium]